MTIEEQVGAYEIKTHLSAYLRHVQAGHRYIVTQRGRPVAELSPYIATQAADRAKAVSDMQAFMDAAPPDGAVDIKTLIARGRD